MDDFRFHDPLYLLALALVPMLAFFAWRMRDYALKRLESFASAKALKRLIRDKNSSSFLPIRRALFYGAIALFLLALARPQGNPVLEEHESVGLDIMVVLDVSRSMDSEDVYPSRLKKAKREINTLLDRMSGDRIGIVAFAGSAALMTPLTSDYEVVRSYLEAIDTNTLQNQGTNIAEGFDVAVEAFKRGGQSGLSADDHSNVIILMSDGESHEGTTFEAVERAQKLGITVYTIAMGTEKGVPIPIRDASGQLLSYKRDPRGENVISKVNPETLKEIAKYGGGIFYFSTLDEGEIGDILAHTEKLQRSSKKEVKAKVYEEYFYGPLFLGFICLFLSLSPGLTTWSLKNFQKTSLFLLFFFALPLAHAEDATPQEQVPAEQIPEAQTPVQSKLWDRNRAQSEAALRKYSAGKFAESTDILKSLQADNPNSPEVSFDLGTSLLKEKKYDEGRATLSEASKSAGLAGIAARMNFAGSYAEEKKIPEAQSAYSEIIHDLSQEKQPTKLEQSLLTQAKKNLELLSSKEQQKQQEKKDEKKDEKKEQKQEQKKQDGEGQKKPEGQPDKPKDDQQKKDSEGKDEKQKQGDQKDKEDKDGKQYDHRRQPFKERQDLSEQDAKRMLEALKQQEGAVQKKFLKKIENNSKLKENETGKDW